MKSMTDPEEKPNLDTYAKNTWCPGCGNFGILKAFKNVAAKLIEEGVSKGRIVLSSGIGCHGKIVDYIRLPSFHVIHGRVPPFLTGMKLANPELLAVGFVGDGDSLNEGMEHMVHSAKRNTDITLFLHNNGVFGLTTGQVTATSPKGFRGRSTPRGNPEDPINPCALMLVSGATFVARGYAGHMDKLEYIMYEAIKHRGFAFVEILQPCVSFNNTWKLYNEKVRWVDGGSDDFYEALKFCQDETLTGIFYRVSRETFEEAVGEIEAENIAEVLGRF